MKRLGSLLLALAVLAGCSADWPSAAGDSLQILATTYPVYLFTTAVTAGAQDVEVALLVNSQTSCLHDYTLTVGDMKAIEAADVIVENGGGLEDFMASALEYSDAAVIECSAGLDLLPSPEHEGHDREEEYDPHAWMDPTLAAQMVQRIAQALGELDPANETLYRENAAQTLEALADFGVWAEDALAASPSGAASGRRGLITFHDGFRYFAEAFGCELLKAIEEEEGSTASARELKEITALVTDRALPAVFVEKNGSTASAEVIARETGCEIYTLDMLMSGDGAGIQPYLTAMRTNLQTVLEAFE